MNNILLGAIVGDFVGSRYEGRRNHAQDKNFTLFDVDNRVTDDTIMTIAVARWLIDKGDIRDFLRGWGNKYPHAGYGKSFKAWFQSPKTDVKNDSWGNGSAMRVSPTAWVSEDLEETLDLAKKSAEWTHNHEEGIKGAQATAACIWLARHGASKDGIKKFVEERFGYDLNRTLDEIKKTYTFSSWCQTSVPESIICFLEGTSYEDTIRNAVWLDGDTDTMAAISGSIAAAFYGGVPEEMAKYVLAHISDDLKKTVMEFDKFVENK